jgi:hypothetical protein
MAGIAQSEAHRERPHQNTRTLLTFGVIAGPLYVAVGLAQAVTREGFDLTRHPLSLLANGPGGWVQSANFVVTGLMVMAAAVGFRRALAPRSRWVSGLLGAFGVSMLLAAIFPADPVDGFPVGTPEGFPTTVSTIGMMHFIVGMLGFLALALSCLFAAPALRRHDRWALAKVSLGCGVAVLGGFVAGPALGAGTLGIWFSVLVGWAWLAGVSVHLRRA